MSTILHALNAEAMTTRQ